MFYQEVFTSIQGESTDAGLLCTFVRLHGCTVGCSFCDQPQLPTQRHKISVENIVAKVEKAKVRNVCITGGEPLLQPEVFSVVYELIEKGYNVSIETSGCFPIEYDHYKRSYKYVMDIKCPCSGVADKNVYNNLINLKPNDEVKFVISNREDYDFFRSVLRKYQTSAKILLSPMFDSHSNMSIGQQLVNWVIEDNLDVRVQIQLHKILNVR